MMLSKSFHGNKIIIFRIKNYFLKFFSFIFRYQNDDKQSEPFEDISMFASNLQSKISNCDLYNVVSALNRANITLALTPIESHSVKSALCFCIVMSTIIDFDDLTFFEDEVRDSELKLIIKFVQRQVSSCYILAKHIPANQILISDLEGQNEDETQDEYLEEII